MSAGIVALVPRLTFTEEAAEFLLRWPRIERRKIKRTIQRYSLRLLQKYRIAKHASAGFQSRDRAWTSSYLADRVFFNFGDFIALVKFMGSTVQVLSVFHRNETARNQVVSAVFRIFRPRPIRYCTRILEVTVYCVTNLTWIRASLCFRLCDNRIKCERPGTSSFFEGRFRSFDEMMLHIKTLAASA